MDAASRGYLRRLCSRVFSPSYMYWIGPHPHPIPPRHEIFHVRKPFILDWARANAKPEPSPEWKQNGSGTEANTFVKGCFAIGRRLGGFGCAPSLSKSDMLRAS